MKRLAWAMVLVSTGVVSAQQSAAPPQANSENAKATHEGVGAGKDTHSQTTVKADSASSSATKNQETKTASTTAAQQPVALHQHPTLVTMLQRSNGIRGRVGLRGHRLNPALCKAAQNHAEYMASTGSFSHYTNGGYVERARRFGFRGNVLENIGWNYANSEQAFAAWQGSGGHYAAIVSGTTDAGFGFARSPSGQTYWVSVYGSATAADIADAKVIFEKDQLAAEEAAAREVELAAAEAAETEDGSMVVPATVLMDVPAEKPAKIDSPAAAPAKPTASAKTGAAPPMGG